MIVYVIYEEEAFSDSIIDIKAVVTTAEKAEKLIEKLKAKNKYIPYNYVEFLLDEYDEI